MYTINLDTVVGILIIVWIIRVVRRILVRARMMKYYGRGRRYY